LYRRLSQDPEELRKRPLLHGDNIAEKLDKILNERREHFENVSAHVHHQGELNAFQADVRVPVYVKHTPAEVATSVARHVLQTLDLNKPSSQVKKEEWETQEMQSGEKTHM
jgi:shikimate kinase